MTGAELAEAKRKVIEELKQHQERVNERTVTFTEEEWVKLTELAEARSTPKKTVEPADCLRAFIASCQPNGSGWKAPC